MPTYEYKCEKCGPFEIWHSIKDNALSACPTCGSKVERLISANVGFVFKGSGFYQNEYKNPSAYAESSASASASAAAPPTADKPLDKKSEVKPVIPKATPEKKTDSNPASDSAPGCGTCGSPDPCGPGNN